MQPIIFALVTIVSVTLSGNGFISLYRFGMAYYRNSVRVNSTAYVGIFLSVLKRNHGHRIYIACRVAVVTLQNKPEIDSVSQYMIYSLLRWQSSR